MVGYKVNKPIGKLQKYMIKDIKANKVEYIKVSLECCKNNEKQINYEGIIYE